jgi:hypothetical protein
MKLVKIVAIPIILAVIVYGIFMLFQGNNRPHSPLPDEGIKVIQVTPGT